MYIMLSFAIIDLSRNTKTHTNKEKEKNTMKNTKTTNTKNTKAATNKNTKSTATKTTKEVKKITVNDMLTVMKALDSKADERKTTTSDLAIQCLSTVNAERIELWKRSESHYDIYVGNATNIAKNLNNDFTTFTKMDNSIRILSYVDDKKMSKREVLIKIIKKEKAFDVVKKVVTELKKYNKETKQTTKEVKESEMIAQ